MENDTFYFMQSANELLFSIIKILPDIFSGMRPVKSGKIHVHCWYICWYVFGAHFTTI